MYLSCITSKSYTCSTVFKSKNAAIEKLELELDELYELELDELEDELELYDEDELDDELELLELEDELELELDEL